MVSNHIIQYFRDNPPEEIRWFNTITNRNLIHRLEGEKYIIYDEHGTSITHINVMDLFLAEDKMNDYTPGFEVALMSLYKKYRWDDEMKEVINENK